MSAVPENEGLLAPSPQLLGQVLLERGLLSEEQLATALEQQKGTGAPLGETLVELGYVPAGLIGQALATQHGGLLKTEYGFATGFGDASPSAPAADPPIMPPSLPPLRLAGDPPPPSLRTDPGPESPAAAPAPVAEVAAAPVVEAKEITPPLEAAPPPPAEAPDELSKRVEELDARLLAAADNAASLERARDGLARDNEKLTSSLADLTRRCDELTAELARAHEASAAPHPETPLERHLAFVGSPAGYSLVEVDGPPPVVDTIVELPEASGVSGRYRVLRVGSANMPGVDAPCVYLLSVG